MAVSVAGGIGALVRYGLQKALPATGSGIPRAVLVVNLVGSLLAGVTVALTVGGAIPSLAGAVVVAGFCGGLTTFSTFAVETAELVRAKAVRSAWLNIVINVVGGVGLAVVGFVVTQSLL